MNAIAMLERCAEHQRGPLARMPVCEGCGGEPAEAYVDGTRLCYVCTTNRAVDRLLLARAT